MSGFETFAKIYGKFYKEQVLAKHRKEKASWPWYGRFQHWLFCSWRCPACKALRAVPPQPPREEEKT